MIKIIFNINNLMNIVVNQIEKNNGNEKNIHISAF